MDVEVARADMTPLLFALSDDERHGIAAMAADRQGIPFLRAVDCQEAVLKAAGRSVVDGLAVIDVSGLLSSDQTTTMDRNRPWRFRQLSVDSPSGVALIVAMADQMGAEVAVKYIDLPTPSESPAEGSSAAQPEGALRLFWGQNWSLLERVARMRSEVRMMEAHPSRPWVGISSHRPWHRRMPQKVMCCR